MHTTDILMNKTQNKTRDMYKKADALLVLSFVDKWVGLETGHVLSVSMRTDKGQITRLTIHDAFGFS